jgi:hypothetical protein
MSTYGRSRYGLSKYGIQPRETASSAIFAQAVDYGIVEVSIYPGPRIGRDYVLVRGKAGAAEEPGQGVIVASGTVNSTIISVLDGVDNFLDGTLGNDVSVPSGTVFYTFFIFDEQGLWLKDAATSVLVPKDEGTTKFFLDHLPRVMTTSTGDPLDHPEPNTDLFNFLGGVSVTYDEFQTLISMILPSGSRAVGTIRGLHEAQARSVGMPINFMIGVSASSRLFRSSGLIYRNKGTSLGVKAYAEALTGWPTDVIESPNMLRSLDDASFESGTGSWFAEGVTLTRLDSGAEYLAPVSDHDYPLSQFASKGLGQVTLTAASGSLSLPDLIAEPEPTQFSTGRTLDNRTRTIPVLADETYYMSAYVLGVESASTLQMRFEVVWIDEFGTLLSPSVGSWITVPADEEWARQTQQFTAPSNAAYAKVRVGFQGSVGDMLVLDRLQFSGLPTHYHDPKSVTVVCAPSRVNLLTNPNFEGPNSWTAISGTATASTEESLLREKSLKMDDETAFVAVSETIPASAGQVFSFAGYFLGDEITLDFDFLDTDDNTLTIAEPDTDSFASPYIPSATMPTSEEWARGEISALAPEDTVAVRIKISGVGTTYMDAIILETSPIPRPYFDLITTDSTQEDTVAAVSGEHVYNCLYPNLGVKLARLRDTLSLYLPLGATSRILLWDSTDPVVVDYLPYGPSSI